MSNNMENSNYRINDFVQNSNPTHLANNKNQSPSLQKSFSPFIIKKSNSLINSAQNQNNFISNKNTSPNFKMYTPSPNCKEKLSDRFIPLKKGVNLMEKFEMANTGNQVNLNESRRVSQTEGDNELLNQISTFPNNVVSTSSPTFPQVGSTENHSNDKLQKNNNYNQLLQSSFFGPNQSYSNFISSYSHTPNNGLKNRIFRFKTDNNIKKNLNIDQTDLNEVINNFSSTTVLEDQRKINKTPFKILDAPNLMDDFYLNLVDWSTQNDLTVGLTQSVYIWSANKSKVSKLCEYGDDLYVSSVVWNSKGTHVAVGTSEGLLDFWDVQYQKKIRTLNGHSARIGAISWCSNTISTGSKDYSILNRDLRTKEDYYSQLQGHKQEVCGLKWSFDETQLASGGNDNRLFIWSNNSDQPLAKLTNHTAAVKAIAWSPHQKNLLATGGGTADRCIRFWNTSTLQQSSFIDTGSQVCNLVFSKNVNELVSTHGYSLNQICVWKIPNMQKIATLTGHTYRVLYLAMSPDGQDIVTGAGDETLRFWNIFPPAKNLEKKVGSSLFPSNFDLR